MKKEYQKPSMDVTFMKVDNQLLAGVSADTKDPEYGGDPTEGQNAKAWQFDVEEEDFKMW
ncbi:aminotransferase [Hoylesella buccalis]|uniref:aminotransferase n=1 Tax=Hoylesella buccalis TaxID=28127 RepID=UPI001D1520BE|nr:aminotransferase [Hoylesella buccalis]UEA62131.1 aminotransferase [Hoylesella buccalis]UWP50586.1 aminotransferase [Hoylesella buccalis ATCC 35310]